MSLREKQQMNLDTESATQTLTGMEGQSRSSSKYLLLQVWCGLLTVAMVAMTVLFATIKPKSTEDGVSTLKPDNGIPTVPSVAPLKSIRSSLSYIQLIKTMDKRSWKENLPRCDSCSLVLRNNFIHCKKNSLYFIYAQVTFSKHPEGNRTKSVILIRNPTYGKSVKKLVEGTFPYTTEGSVWVANIVSLEEEDSISLDINGDFLTEGTFWGAYQLH